MHQGMSKLAIALAVSASWAVVQPAQAQTFTGTFYNSTTEHTDTASATFSEVTGAISGTSLIAGTNLYLQVVLANTSTFSGYGNADLLGGLFFSIASNTRSWKSRLSLGDSRIGETLTPCDPKFFAPEFKAWVERSRSRVWTARPPSCAN
jgi:hypothetical protein